MYANVYGKTGNYTLKMDVDDGVEVKPFQILAIIGAEKCNISV
jgi:hypothetical protein